MAGRKEKYRTVEIHLNVDTLRSKGSLNNAWDYDPRRGDFPSSDTHYRSLRTIYLGGENVRLNVVGEEPHATVGGTVEHDDTLVKTKTGVRTLRQATDLPTGAYQGGITKDHLELRVLLYQPLLWFFGRAMPFDGYGVDPSGQSINGRPVVVLRNQAEHETLYLDADHGYVVVRFESVWRNQERVLDVSYGANADGVYLPVRWNLVSKSRRDGTLIYESSVAVVKSLLNPALAPDLFELPFPVGTLVVEDKEEGGELHYRLLPDGGKEVIRPSSAKSRASGRDGK